MQMSAMNKENDSNVFKKNAQRSQKNDMVERDGSEWTRKDIAGGQKKKESTDNGVVLTIERGLWWRPGWKSRGKTRSERKDLSSHQVVPVVLPRQLSMATYLVCI
jgi:hypothetical protein